MFICFDIETNIDQWAFYARWYFPRIGWWLEQIKRPLIPSIEQLHRKCEQQGKQYLTSIWIHSMKIRQFDKRKWLIRIPKNEIQHEKIVISLIWKWEQAHTSIEMLISILQRNKQQVHDQINWIFLFHITIWFSKTRNKQDRDEARKRQRVYFTKFLICGLLYEAAIQFSFHLITKLFV